MCGCQSTSGSASGVHIPSTYPTSIPLSVLPPEHGKCTWHTLISAPTTPSTDMSCGIGMCPPLDGSLALHRHTQAEIYHVLEGKGIVTIDGKEIEVEKGSTVFIPGDAEHGVKNVEKEELKWFYVFPTDDFGKVVYKWS